MRKIKEILKKVAEYLNERNIDYVVVGGLAVFFHGTPRSTMDIDFLMKVDKNDIKSLVSFLKENDFFASERDFNLALKEESHCSMIDRESSLRLDIKGIYDKRDRKTLENKVSVNFEGTKINIASPEDTVVNKLLFGSEQDIKDAKSIIIRQEDLDEEYIKKLTKEIGVLEDYKSLKRDVKESLRKYTKGDY
ncbi:MAG: nucleotidyltransferase [Candidatus Aenigmatarchaeota archaeon]